MDWYVQCWFVSVCLSVSLLRLLLLLFLLPLLGAYLFRVLVLLVADICVLASLGC